MNGIIFHFNNWCVVILAHSEPVQLPGSLEGFLCGVSVFEVLSTCSLLRAQKPPFQESMYSLSFYNDLSFTPKHRSCLPFFFYFRTIFKLRKLLNDSVVKNNAYSFRVSLVSASV